jgi:hypothetical protein
MMKCFDLASCQAALANPGMANAISAMVTRNNEPMA